MINAAAQGVSGGSGNHGFTCNLIQCSLPASTVWTTSRRPVKN
jgi:hypothetical protein